MQEPNIIRGRRETMKKWTALLMAISLAAVLTTGCQKKAEPTPEAVPTAADTTAVVDSAAVPVDSSAVN